MIKFNFFLLVFWMVFGDQIEKVPLDDIKKELASAGVSTEAIEQLLQVLSIKSLPKLEGWCAGSRIYCLQACPYGAKSTLLFEIDYGL